MQSEIIQIELDGLDRPGSMTGRSVINRVVKNKEVGIDLMMAE